MTVDTRITVSVIIIATVLWIAVFAMSPQKAIESHRYQLSNGETITCNGQNYSPCGMHYFHCDNGKTYDCQTNVKNL